MEFEACLCLTKQKKSHNSNRISDDRAAGAGGRGKKGKAQKGKQSRSCGGSGEDLFLPPQPESPPFMPYVCNLVVVWQMSTVREFLCILFRCVVRAK